MKQNPPHQKSVAIPPHQKIKQYSITIVSSGTLNSILTHSLTVPKRFYVSDL